MPVSSPISEVLEDVTSRCGYLFLETMGPLKDICSSESSGFDFRNGPIDVIMDFIFGPLAR